MEKNGNFVFGRDEGRVGRRRYAQTSMPTLYFRDGILSIPGYAFEKATRWEDTGSSTMLCEGNSLKDGSLVLAKIAPAHTNAAVMLDREAHIIGLLQASSEASSTIVRLIEVFTIPRTNGDCVVLLMVHPGPNQLGHHFPRSKINDLLLSDVTPSYGQRPVSRGGPPSHSVFFMEEDDTPMLPGDSENVDTMDLATFLEFAIQATYCLEMLHKLGLVHREVRANAFHINSHSGAVRLVHFGNRSVSLEQFGGPSSLVIHADTYEEIDKNRVKEALCYLAPEQTGSTEANGEDSRTDLYSLGVLFWTLIVGRGVLPFEGGPLEILHSIVQKRPMPVHEVRRDVPHVLAQIVEKLLSKNADQRYQSAYGLKQDLLECQRRLLASVSSMSDQALDLIPMFEIAQQDRYMDFTLPTSIFGREKELETIRAIVKHASSTYSHYATSAKGAISLTPSSSQNSGSLGNADQLSDIESKSTHSGCAGRGSDDSASRMDISPVTTASGSPSNTITASTMTNVSDGIRRIALHTHRRGPHAHSILVIGSPGLGKTSLVLANQAKWRAHGLWGHAKFQANITAPFAALLSCLSSVLRQLMVFSTDLHRFIGSLKVRLGPQIRNIPLLYDGAPELRDILDLFNMSSEIPQESLPTRELRARFQSLVEIVFSVLAETRLFALFLDDLQDADESSLDLITTLAGSRSNLLFFVTIRDDRPEFIERARGMFKGPRATWIMLEPLSFTAVAALCTRVLRHTKEAVAPLARLIHTISSGNAFSARNLLVVLHRQKLITYDPDGNHWRYDLALVQSALVMQKVASDPNDLAYLVEHLRELPEEARRYIVWASFFGSTFKVTDVSLVMDREESSGSQSEDEEPFNFKPSKREWDQASTSRGSIHGLQVAIAEGWLVQRGRDMCSFAHDRYRQAAELEAHSHSEGFVAKMSYRILMTMLREPTPDMYQISERAQKCLDLLRRHPKRDELIDLLISAGEAAQARGAHEQAYQSFVSARSLLDGNEWKTHAKRTFSLYLKLAELSTWRGDGADSDAYVSECYSRAEHPEDKAIVLRLRSRNHWIRNELGMSLDDTVLALHALGVDINLTPDPDAANVMFEQVKNEILAVGFEAILSIPRSTDSRIDLAVDLLGDAGIPSLISQIGIGSHWNIETGITDVIGLTVRGLTAHGMSRGTSLGFLFALEAAAERRELYRFSADLGKLALRISERFGSSSEKCRSLVLFSAVVSGYDNTHIRSNVPRLEEAMKYAGSAGDRGYGSLASLYMIQTKLFTCEHLDELVTAAEESCNDITLWAPEGHIGFFATSLLCCIRALSGATVNTSPSMVYDTLTFSEEAFLSRMITFQNGAAITMAWWVVSLYCLGHAAEAAVLGFKVYESRRLLSNHRHTRYSLFFHSLALITCVRDGGTSQATAVHYLEQVQANQAYLRKWLSPSPVNNSMWIALVDAEVASLEDSPDTYKMYDVAVKLAVNNDWLLEEGWALFLQGSHFVRQGVDNLGSELQRRGIARQSQWGAQGIVTHLSTSLLSRSQESLKRHIFSSDVGVQTESTVLGVQTQPKSLFAYEDVKPEEVEEDEAKNLPAADLAAVLKWSKDISRHIQLFSTLQRLTEIAVEASGAQSASVVITGGGGEYSVATSMIPPGHCKVFEDAPSIRTIKDPLQKAIIEHCLNVKERIAFNDATSDNRFASDALESPHRSVICLPIFGNRGQTFGALFLASKYAFSSNQVVLLTLLCQQANISVANALLFRSVQAGTRENLKMISAQREALEVARQSREAAEKAAKIKSNFLASMSHELRTPFSSFYGLLDLLASDELQPRQRDIVQTAKQSCDHLLKVINSILDYSKLEASGVKLEFTGFAVEDVIADCLELLLPTAAQKLDLSFNIDRDVPPWVTADYERIRQILMNLIGNAVKFTQHGSVKVLCSVDTETLPPVDHVTNLKFVIRDTGIGLSPTDVDHLFVPFQQADNSTTRRFGGTGLGLSICRELVKLMGGVIGVNSELGKGSVFWFTIPTKPFSSEESRLALLNVENIRNHFIKLRPPTVLVCSPSDATRALLGTMLFGFRVTAIELTSEVFSTEPGRMVIPTFDFIIFDYQGENEIRLFVESLKIPALQATKVIHLYTPVASDVTGQSLIGDDIPGVRRMTKPPRAARLLQTMAGLSQMPPEVYGSVPDDQKMAVEEKPAPKRTLYGNILIAEDNVVAQQLLIRQLSSLDLTVTATANGEEAISEWESHEPGFFSLALFDHHMPICDGVEAAKRIRLLESRRKIPPSLVLPIVALSADCQDSTKRLCLSAGMNDFHSKPLKRGTCCLLRYP
ncbi:histidine kinase [Vararia minispora EC-137]|uniref:Histidine kinase n=1 Tax=Vararia minispora EC-137 TaxID=1314806 RepID=A0ACB8Q9L5_9AGAM|nr:histidine kinase [Vararia minispora EC-137]